MKMNQWHLLMMNLDDNGGFPSDPLLSNTFKLLSHVSCFVDHSKHLLIPVVSASIVRFSKLAGACFFWFSGASHVKTNFHDRRGFRSRNTDFPTFSFKHLFRRPEYDHLLPVLSLASGVIPPFDNLTSNMLAIPPADASVRMLGALDQTPCDVQHGGCFGHSFPDLNWIRRAVEPITGIEFPGVLNNILTKENKSNIASEVLVGTGSRTVTIIKIKSLKVYAFGFYVHPYSVCQKLGSKYASVPAAELKDRNDFYADLLREDIGMTVRLVVNCNGMKTNAVKDTFEKSLRARLVKTNPETDFKCIETFGSFFTKDIPLPVGTVIDLRRTEDGQLITEIGGTQIGAVRSRELCRAFFDMYLGEVPAFKETKEEIGSNVASIVKRC